MPIPKNVTARYVMLCREPRKKGNWRTTFEIAEEFFYAPLNMDVPPLKVLQHTWYTNTGYGQYIPSNNPQILWKVLQDKGFYFKFIRINGRIKAVYKNRGKSL